MAHSFAPNPNINHARCLEKSLRLPRTYPKVADWLFSEAHLPYHRSAPLLSPTAFAASRTVKLEYAFLNVATSNFDIFGIEDGPPPIHHPNPAEHHHNHQHPQPNGAPPSKGHSIMTAELLFTPVTRAAPTVIVGYAMLMGSMFDPSVFGSQTGAVRGKAHFNGRYAYDVDNNHFIIVINAVTEHHTLIIDLTFAGISRERYYYSVPCRSYSANDLPSRVLSLFSTVEVRVPPNSQYTSSDHCQAPDQSPSSDATDAHASTEHPVTSIMADVNAMRNTDPRLTASNATSTDDLLAVLGDSSLATEVSGSSTSTWKEIFSLASDMRILIEALTGHFKSPRFTRDTFDLENPNLVISRVQGGMAGSMSAPEPGSHRHALVYGWQEYSASACALQTERILNGNLLGGDMGMGMAAIANGAGDSLFGNGAGGQPDKSWLCQEQCDALGAGAIGRCGESGGTSSSTGDGKEANATAIGGDGVVEEMAPDDERVRDMRTCQTCKGLIGRKGVTMVDEETMKREKLEAKKRKNRLSAARSNQRRKEREEQQRAELSERQRMVHELTARRDALRAENAMLRSSAQARGLLPLLLPPEQRQL